MNRGYKAAKVKAEAEIYEDNEWTKDQSSSRRVANKGQVQNSKTARVYVFGQNDVYEDDEENIELSEIRSRKSNRNGGQSVSESSLHPADRDNIFFERQIGEEDTLASIALQYGCPIAELKRINKLIRDQDFFALPTIKVPIKRYGVLSELLEQQKLSGASGAAASSPPRRRTNSANGAASSSCERMDYIANDVSEESDHCLSDPEMQNLLIRTLSIRDNMKSQSREAEDFLNSMDEDLQKIRKSTNNYKPSLQDVKHTLTDMRIRPLHKDSRWTDCSLSWRQIVGFALVVAIVVPLLILSMYCYSNDCHFS